MNRTGRATGELLGIDFGVLSDRTLYRASDPLFKHKKAREDHRIGAVETLFNRPPVVTLYDRTNTSFEGEAAGPPKAKHGAKHGPSKERRTVSVSDAPLLTLSEGPVKVWAPFSTAAAFCAARGLFREIFPGNVVEAHTQETMLTSLEVPGHAWTCPRAGLS